MINRRSFWFIFGVFVGGLIVAHLFWRRKSGTITAERIVLREATTVTHRRIQFPQIQIRQQTQAFLQMVWANVRDRFHKIILGLKEARAKMKKTSVIAIGFAVLTLAFLLGMVVNIKSGSATGNVEMVLHNGDLIAFTVATVVSDGQISSAEPFQFTQVGTGTAISSTRVFAGSYRLYDASFAKGSWIVNATNDIDVQLHTTGTVSLYRARPRWPWGLAAILALAGIGISLTWDLGSRSAFRHLRRSLRLPRRSPRRAAIPIAEMSPEGKRVQEAIRNASAGHSEAFRKKHQKK